MEQVSNETADRPDQPLPGGYLRVAPPPPQGTFEIGLVMAGAVSAGAFTGGVIDFLVEALDRWEGAKARERREKGLDPTTWSVPGHAIRLRIMAGASAGSITAAISAVALRYTFPHVREGDSAAMGQNPFYRAWVKDVDLTKLLGLSDLKDDNTPVISLLDSTALKTIAQSAISYNGPPPPSRPYLASPMRYVFTLGNLRGVPYFMSLQGNTKDGHAMVAHGDYAGFCVEYGAAPLQPTRADDAPLPFPNSSQIPTWARFGETALASGAFPVGLMARPFSCDGHNYDYRFVLVPGMLGQPADVIQLLPQWSSEGVPNPFRSLMVDGGTMNNEPLDIARTELAGIAGQNPRGGTTANRAIVMIDPFPDEAGAVDDPLRGQTQGILPVAMALLNAWKDQARFKPVDLALASDNKTYSRFLIAPDRSKSTESNGFALAGGALGGFSGFLSEAFRHHDYMLGRRNCQQFLRRHFCLPVGNDGVFGKVNPALKVAGSPWVVADSDGLFLPIIPLCDGLEREEPLPRWPTGAYDPRQLSDPLDGRLDRVIEVTLRTSLRLNWFFRQLAQFGLRKVRKIAVERIIAIVHKALQERKLI